MDKDKYRNRDEEPTILYPFDVIEFTDSEECEHHAVVIQTEGLLQICEIISLPDGTHRLGFPGSLFSEQRVTVIDKWTSEQIEAAMLKTYGERMIGVFGKGDEVDNLRDSIRREVAEVALKQSGIAWV